MLSKNQEHFVKEMVLELELSSSSSNTKKHNKSTYEKKAKGLGITDQTEIKELVELALYLRAKNTLEEFTSGVDAFEALVDDYNKQPNISHRSSQSIIYQQYSTPLPIAYAMGYWCGLHENNGKTVIEPSAGNALLLVANELNSVYANEIDLQRFKNLQYLLSKDPSFKIITKLDASQYLDQQHAFELIYIDVLYFTQHMFCLVPLTGTISSLCRFTFRVVSDPYFTGYLIEIDLHSSQ
jgi:hypothetical protein